MHDFAPVLRNTLIELASSSWRDSPLLLLVFTILLYPSASSAAWVRVTCKGDYKYSESEPLLSCLQSDWLEDGTGYFIPGYSRAEANRDTGKLSVGSGGGLIDKIGFNGGKSTAYLSKSFTVDGKWIGWLPVTVKVDLNYFFAGYGTSHLKVNLRTLNGRNLGEKNQTGLTLHYDGYQRTTLTHSDSKGCVSIPEERIYSEDDSLTLYATHMIHHSSPVVDVRVDLLAWSLPNLNGLSSSISASIDADASIVIME